MSLKKSENSTKEESALVSRIADKKLLLHLLLLSMLLIQELVNLLEESKELDLQ
jgi:hypothetical protein